MEITEVQHIDGVTLVKVQHAGTKYSTVREATEAFRQVICNYRSSNLVLDLSRLDYANSSTFSLLIWIWRYVRERSGRLAICRVAPRVYEVMKTIKIDTLLTIFGTVPEAVAHLKSE
jgi:anti-anti-sigma factor